MSKKCNRCGVGCYGDLCYRCKPRKQIKAKGKKALSYEKWRDEVAIPHLDKTTGRICSACGGARCGNQQLDVEHTKNRGSHPHLAKSLSNVTYMGRYPCHYEKTNNINYE